MLKLQSGLLGLILTIVTYYIHFTNISTLDVLQKPLPHFEVLSHVIFKLHSSVLQLISEAIDYIFLSLSNQILHTFKILERFLPK